MNNLLMLISSDAMDRLAVSQIMSCNESTARYGLVLSNEDANELVQTRGEALCANGRIELSGGIIKKLIHEFCSSPFIIQSNYASILHDLVEMFYYFKNETLDEVSDDELVALMREYFDNRCRGSIELLQGRDLEMMARNVRYSNEDYANLSGDEYGEEAQEDFDEQY